MGAVWRLLIGAGSVWAPLPMDLGQCDIGQTCSRIERDRIFQVGDGLVQLRLCSSTRPRLAKEQAYWYLVLGMAPEGFVSNVSCAA